jgi:hypothetical protein
MIVRLINNLNRLNKNWMTNSFIMGIISLFVLSANPLTAGVIFEDDFNAWSDYTFTQTVTSESCSSPCSSIPAKWWGVRSQGTVLDPNTKNTIYIESTNARSGKCFTHWQEANINSGGWQSGGTLSTVFNYQSEVYARAYYKFQPDWRWWQNGGNSPMLKMLRIVNYESDDAAPWSDATGSFETLTRPRIILQLVRWNKGLSPVGFNFSIKYSDDTNGSGDWTENIQNPKGGGDCIWSEPGCPGDGNWHSWELYVKLNNPAGVANGELKFWYDGILVSTKKNLNWITSGSITDTTSMWNSVSIGGNDFNPYSDNAEQWYAIDDLVISTTYIGPDGFSDKIPPDKPFLKP